MRNSSDRETTASTRGSAWVLALLTLVLLSGFAFFWLGSGDAVDTPAIDPGFETGATQEISEDDAQAPSTDLTADGIGDAQPLAAPTRTDGPKATARESGTIRGHLQIPRELRLDVRVWALQLEEAVNDASPRATREVQRLRRRFETVPGLSIARFRIDDVPFSEYGWHVVAQSLEPYASSETALIALSAARPEAEVQLTLVKAPTVHFTVKDQDKRSLRDVRVTIKPVGFPPQRKTHTGKTDVYGLAIFEQVALGDYELRVGPVARPLVTPRRISIRANTMQFEPIVVPKGGTLDLVITTTSGAGVDQVEIAALAKDIKRYKKFEAKTDSAGRATLEHLPPGLYYVNLAKTGFERRFEKITIEEGQRTEKRITLHWDFRR